MIQRIQSLYLSIGAAIQLFFAFGTIYTYQTIEGDFTLNAFGIYNAENVKVNGDMKTFILALITALLAIVAIFLFKNRKNQMKIARITGLLTFMEIVFVVVSYFNIQDLALTSFAYGASIFALPISTILFFLAAKAIKKDDDLVKSVDRIR